MGVGISPSGSGTGNMLSVIVIEEVVEVEIGK